MSVLATTVALRGRSTIGAVSPTMLPELAGRTAVGIMAARLAYLPATFKAWHQAASIGTPLGEHQTSVERYVKTLLGRSGFTEG